jgi:hypothetical protein
MTQALYAHMNNKTIKKSIIIPAPYSLGLCGKSKAQESQHQRPSCSGVLTNLPMDRK